MYFYSYIHTIICYCLCQRLQIYLGLIQAHRLAGDEMQAQEMIQVNTVEMSSIEISNWFAGAKQETNVTSVKESTTINRSSLISKKEQYLKSGFSTKTILIRSIMKKADGYVNATV